ncbi:TonB-dependent receptor [Qipengyuania flava]|jgi:outer membrane receptor protein involved in Fe transport|uniref:TonB-dependent receptor n=1 Tax=Qipengyuania flava TaxID=192812 RepID=UPI00141B16D9|nr:TonB-dependent receptor [Qipengyuania flava]NIJ62867.1 outer membrane receptor protein involved in Fe transport [Qipengyuania flava]
MKFNTFGRAATVRTSLLAGAAALALPAAAQAQDTDADFDDEGAGVEAPVNSNVIVVTATKREQTLQETPVAVSVTSAETIEQAQIRDVSDLATVVPSLQVSQNQSSFATSYSVRGFGTDGNNIGLEPSVAMFVDGVYRSRAVSQISDLPDIQRVEVLRGPQSTLFGKNASAGVISIVTKEPQFDFGGMVEASYGNYDAMVVKGFVTGPISDSVAFSAGGGINKRDGFLTNGANGEDINDRDRWFTRGQLLFDNGGPLRVRVIGDYDKIEERCCGVLNVAPSAEIGAIQLLGGQVNDFRNNPDGDVVFTDVDPINEVENYGISGQIDYEFGALTLTSITAYRKTKLAADQDVDFTSLDAVSGANIGDADIDTFTQELRIASDFDGPLNFLVGGYYFDEQVDTSDQIVYGNGFRPFANLLLQGATGGTQTVDTLEATLSALNGTDYTGQFFAAGQGFFNNIVQDNEAFSIFGNVDFEITDRLVLTLGANYTKDKKQIVTNSTSTDVFSNIDLVASGNTAIFAQGLATQVGSLLSLGRPATQAEIGAFAGANPAAFAQVSAGVQAFADANDTDPAVNSLLALTPFQFLPPLQNCPNAVEDCSTDDDDWSWNVRLAYEVTPTLNVYASWATGYKAPSFNLSRDSRPLPADFAALQAQGLAVTNLRPGTRFANAENSEVYEVGIKGNWSRAAANLTFFQQSIEDFQANTFTGTSFILSNAGKQETFGVEFDGQFYASDSLTLSVAMTYLDAQYDSFVASPVGDLSGEPVAGVPELSAVLGAQYNKEINSRGDRIILRGDFAYSSPVQMVNGLTNFIVVDPATGARDFGPARAAAAAYKREVNNLNASFTYAFDMGLELSVWARNLLDDRYLTTVFPAVAQGQAISGYPNQPRTYGVAARFRF